MNFKQFLKEYYDPRKPSSSIKTTTTVKNSGTNLAQSMRQTVFTTAKGNKVRVLITPEGEGSHSVIFYVNDTLYDSSSQTEDSKIDNEIIPGVLYVMKLFIKKNSDNINEITFSAFKGDKDTKIVRNLDIKKALVNMERHLEMLMRELNAHVPVYHEPSENLKKIMAKKGQVPRRIPDIDVEPIKLKIHSIKDNPFIEDIKDIGYFLTSRADITKTFPSAKLASKAVIDYANALKSHTKDGTEITQNRRAKIYDRLVNRHFSDVFDIHKDGDEFTLTKKNNGI